jgi:prepilin peptidase CpaA
MTAQVGIALVVGVAAIVEDVARRKISNWIPAVALGGGFVALTHERGLSGAGSSLAGTAAGFAVFLIFYLLGGMGGGDVKLMAGFGAVLGWERLPEAALWTAVCGGLIAAVTLLIGSVRNHWGCTRSAEQERPPSAIPYAPAIAVGAWLALVPQV